MRARSAGSSQLVEQSLHQSHDDGVALQVTDTDVAQCSHREPSVHLPELSLRLHQSCRRMVHIQIQWALGVGTPLHMRGWLLERK